MNKYAEPEFSPISSSEYAATITYSPEIDAENPNLSYSNPSLAVSFCCSFQFEPSLLNIYAEPEYGPLSSSW